jgi:hypothetical protein
LCGLALSSSIWRDSGRGFARTQKQRHKQALIDSPRFKAKFPAHAGEFFAEAPIGCLGRERFWARPPDRALAPCWSPSLSRKVSAHAGNDPSRAKCRPESTAEPVKCVAEAVGFGDAENMRWIQRRLKFVCCTNDRACSLRRHAAELSGFSIVLDSGGTGSLTRWTASFAFALR